MLILPKSIEVVTKYDVFWEKHKQRYYMVSKCQSVKVSKCQTDRGSVILGSNILYILNILFISGNFCRPKWVWHFDTLTPLTPLDCLEYWISISCKALQCIQRAIRPLFWWKNGRADGRKNLLFGVLRIVFGLQLSICGVVDLPILGSNLVKTGVQGAIFDKFWWSLNRSARIRCEGASLVKMLRCWGVKVLTDSA